MSYRTYTVTVTIVTVMCKPVETLDYIYIIDVFIIVNEIYFVS